MHFVRLEPMTTQPGRLHRLLAFLDPLLGGPTLIVEPYHRPARQRQVRYDEAYLAEQFPKVEFHLRHDPPRFAPTRRFQPEGNSWQ